VEGRDVGLFHGSITVLVGLVTEENHAKSRLGQLTFDWATFHVPTIDCWDEPALELCCISASKSHLHDAIAVSVDACPVSC